MLWSMLLGCPKSLPTAAPCSPLEAGTHTGLAYDHRGVQRTYLLHVPADIGCNAEVLFDLHGALAGDEPETFYALDAAIQAADDAGYVLVRPRGLPIQRQGREWWYWNVPEHLEGHADFFEALYDELSPDGQLGTRWVLGYSSGADLVGWMLSRGRDWQGFAMVGGSLWTDSDWEGFTPEGRSVYLQLGTRDAAYFQRHLTYLEQLEDRGLPPRALFADPGRGGHQLGALHYAHAIPFFRQEHRPEPLADASEQWSTTPLPHLATSVDHTPEGTFVGDITGRVRRDGEIVHQLDTPILDLCGDDWILTDVLVGPDGEQSLDDAPVSLGCGSAAPVAVGRTIGERVEDDWIAGPSAYAGWHDAAVAPSGEGAVVVGPYGSTGIRDEEGWQTGAVTTSWLNGVAWAESIWIVGDQGLILRSDDANVVSEVGSFHPYLPLYAVDAVGSCAAAVGHGGLALWTEGDAWRPLNLPTADTLTDVTLTDEAIIAVGSGGIWHHPWPGGACASP